MTHPLVPRGPRRTIRPLCSYSFLGRQLSLCHSPIVSLQQAPLRVRHIVTALPQRPVEINPVLTSSTFAERLAEKKSPTLLYEAPSHFWYNGASISSGLFCFAYAAFNYWDIFLTPPPNLPWWVPHAYAVICMFMSGMGTYFFLGISRVVRTFQAIPATQALPSSTRNAPVGKAFGNANSPIFIEIGTRRWIPFTGLKRRLFRPDAVVLPCPMRQLETMGTVMNMTAPPSSQVASAAQARGRLAAKRAEVERKEAERQYEIDHLLTAPFRDMRRGLKAAVQGIKRSMTREGFATIMADGKKFKIDVTGGWMLDNGRAIDRLVVVRKN